MASTAPMAAAVAAVRLNCRKNRYHFTQAKKNAGNKIRTNSSNQPKKNPWQK
jgi:hypothetical protein